MARILTVIPAMNGILHAALEVARRLRQEGHDALIGCPWDLRDKVESAGFEYVQLEAIPADPGAAPEHASGDGRLRRAMRALRTAPERRRRALETMERGDLVEAVARHRIDFLLLHVELHELALTAAHHGLPFTLLSQWYPFTRRAGVPPIRYGLIPKPVGPAGRLRLERTWARQRAEIWWLRTRAGLRSLGCDRRAALKAYARKTGFPLRRWVEYSWLQPFTYRDMPVVSMTDAALDFPSDPEPGVRHVGPMVSADRPEELDPAEDARLTRLLEERDRTGNPLIYCSVTTFGQGDAGFLGQVVEVARRRPDRLFALGLGGGLDPETLGPLPPNVCALAWAPQLRLLAHSALSINHGGGNTIHECIHFRVPMLIYSGGQHDQHGCSARMAYHGLALLGDREHDGPDQIEARIERVLAEPSYREAVDAAHRRYRAYADDGVLARAVRDAIAAAART